MAKTSKGKWAVVVSWEECGKSYESICDDNLSEVQAIDVMIAKESAYAGTGRTFTCLKKGANRE